MGLPPEPSFRLEPCLPGEGPPAAPWEGGLWLLVTIQVSQLRLTPRDQPSVPNVPLMSLFLQNTLWTFRNLIFVQTGKGVTAVTSWVMWLWNKSSTLTAFPASGLLLIGGSPELAGQVPGSSQDNCLSASVTLPGHPASDRGRDDTGARDAGAVLSSPSPTQGRRQPQRQVLGDTACPWARGSGWFMKRPLGPQQSLKYWLFGLLQKKQADPAPNRHAVLFGQLENIVINVKLHNALIIRHNFGWFFFSPTGNPHQISS